MAAKLILKIFENKLNMHFEYEQLLVQLCSLLAVIGSLSSKIKSTLKLFFLPEAVIFIWKQIQDNTSILLIYLRRDYL